MIFELFSRKFLINGKHSCSFSAAPTPKSVSCPGGEPQTTYATFRLLFRSKVQISNCSFQSIFFNKLLFLGNGRTEKPESGTRTGTGTRT